MAAPVSVSVFVSSDSVKVVHSNVPKVGTWAVVQRLLSMIRFKVMPPT